MAEKTSLKIKSLVHLYEHLTEEERIITDVLRQIIIETLPLIVKKKYRITCHSFMATGAFVWFGQPASQEAALKKA